MKKTNSRTLLTIGFGTILILLAIMTANWLNYIQETTERIEEILEEQKETALVFKMRDSAHMRTLILHRIALLDDSFDRDDEYMEFKEHASEFIKARDALVKMGMNKEEEKIWIKAKQLIFQGGNTQLNTVEHFLEDRNTTARNLLLNEVTPIQNKVMAELTKMLEIQRAVMQRAAKATVTANDHSYKMVLFFGLIIILIGGSVAVFTIRSSGKNEKELIKTQQAAESANQYKSLFLANMSHEIRTPLTAVIGYAESLLDNSLNKTDRLNHTTTIIRNGKHLLQIINDILDLSKIEANKLDVEIIDVSPLEILAEVESVMGQIAREKGLDFQIQYLFPIPKIISSDPTRLKQILLNILSNAIKFTERGSITINCSYDSINNKMTFTVTDTGIGMGEETIENIFNPFSQADASTTRKYGGTGLGLTISRQLANMLGGDLNCTSQPGKGTRFILNIDPAEIHTENLLFAIPKDWSSNKQDDQIKTLQASGTILLAEDSPDIQGLVSMYIKRTGADVIAVENGQLAVEQAMSNDFDLILMDMQMPIMDGMQATQMLRSTGYGGTIIALTANAMKEDQKKYREAGINDFIAKPIDLKKFYSVLNKYLETNHDNRKNNQTIDSISQLTEKFLQSLPNILLEFSTALNQKNAQTLIQAAHKLKGMGGSFGYPEITEISSKIELLAKENNLQKANVEFNTLDEFCKNISK